MDYTLIYKLTDFAMSILSDQNDSAANRTYAGVMALALKDRNEKGVAIQLTRITTSGAEFLLQELKKGKDQSVTDAVPESEGIMGGANEQYKFRYCVCGLKDVSGRNLHNYKLCMQDTSNLDNYTTLCTLHGNAYRLLLLWQQCCGTGDKGREGIMQLREYHERYDKKERDTPDKQSPL